MRGLFVAAVVTMFLACAAVAVLCMGCSPSTPTPAQQADLGMYEASLQACIGRARLNDAGYYSYKACADGVTDLWFPKDGGVR